MTRLTPDYQKANACNILLAILSPHLTILTTIILDYARNNVLIQTWILGFWVIIATTFLITIAVRYYYYEIGVNGRKQEVRI